MGEALTRKAGPLPVWAWAAVALVAFLAFRHLHPSGAAAATSTTGAGTPSDNAATDQPYMPGFDASTGGNAVGGGIGAAGVPTVINNYYYGDQATQQALGGGTASGAPASGAPQRRVDPGVGGLPKPPPLSSSTLPTRTPSGAF